MSLQYRILWVDDHKKDFIDANLDEELKNFISSLFYIPELDFCDNIDEAYTFLHKKYDVIFSDYNIDEDKGNIFIQKIRDKNIKTEVLFYSGQSDLPEGKLDRVSYFFMNDKRSWYERLLAKMKEQIQLTVDKMSDLSSVRGLVIAEVSDLDMQMENLIRTYYQDCNEITLSSKRESFNKHIVNKAEASLRSMLKKGDCKEICKHSWFDKSIDEIISKVDFDSSKKARTIKLIIKEIQFGNEVKRDKFYDEYLSEIIQNRNNLAHCVSCVDTDVEILKTKKGDIVFTKDDFQQLRSNILKYKKLFEELEIVIKKMYTQNTGKNRCYM